jgi:hypothetical protein
MHPSLRVIDVGADDNLPAYKDSIARAARTLV